MSKIINYTVYTGGVFLAGFITGTMLNSEKKDEIRLHLSANTTRAETWLRKQKEATLERIEQKITDVKQLLEKNLADPVPDLYRATESFSLEDDDLSNV